ncbi:shuttle craft protein [Coprinopsis sp. MPI-PUGE-AT-0042]|nr:shuttle craft protein [Coprinopsis sp. MPI-PUGE-AT-0042]
MEGPQTVPVQPATLASGSAPAEGSAGSRRQGPRRPRGGKGPGQRTEGQASGSAANSQRGGRPPRRPRPNRGGDQQQTAASGPADASASQQEGSTAHPQSKPRHPRRPRKPQGDAASEASSQHSEKSTKPSRPPPNRRAKFGGQLTQEGTAGEDNDNGRARGKRSDLYKTNNPLGDDLASTLIRSLSTPPYPDCPICFSAIQPSQAMWSCSPVIPVVMMEGAQVQYCWTPFHMGCIKSWAAKSVKDGEPEKRGDWRCPGCQAKREIVPSGYRCFCGSVPEPKLARLSTPHSCGQPCSRPRESGCGHPCPLLCHPGPCPPCQVTSHFKCYCPRKTVLSFRCGASKGKRDLSCGQVCEQPLNCGKHQCPSVCHDGDCAPCSVLDVAKCYCGKHEKEMLCGDGQAVDCFTEGETPWIGRYSCDSACSRPFDCGVHTCEKPCHPPSASPVVCPKSPSQVTNCPCGKATIAPPGASDLSQYDFPPRPNCKAPIPTCQRRCSKPHSGCSHPCTSLCHTGPCPPCMEPIIRPCRCGATTRKIPCHEAYNQDASDRDFLCDRACTALRACGRHQCHRICCPLASLASVAKKGKKRVVDTSAQAIGTERGGLHECDLVCGKTLSCGNHRCEEKDHKGPCPPCLRSTFEEVFCACGRTELEPPVPCGTRIQCSFPCPRGPAPCGHSRTIHGCHDDSIPCPPCVHLVGKSCACGKKTVPNVRCSLEQDKVSCGTVCGKPMPCGFHLCESLCHSGDCGACTAPCGKTRKLCLPNQHPCTLPCHAPSSCPETEPCESVVQITCPCGRVKQAVQCGKRVSNAAGYQPPPIKCTTECAIAKRNARLADALGINPQDKDKDNVVYNDDLVGFARANSKFLPIVEKAFADFVKSEKKHQVLPHMTPDKRKFVHDLANVYRMDTQMIDQEPNRSVQLIRRLDTRIPNSTLSAHLSSLAPNLGKLTDLRSLKPASTPSSSSGGASTSSLAYVNVNPKPSSTSQASAGRGWTSVVRPTPGGSSVPFLAPPSATVSRTVSPKPAGSAAPPRVQPPPATASEPAVVPAVQAEPVTENWEDDL